MLAGPAEHVVTASTAVGKAWERFGEVAEQIAGLREVQAGLTAETAGRDTEAAFLLTHDDPRDLRLWGASYGARHRTRERPWPTDRRGYTAWLITSGVDLWVPTGSERDHRWGEVFDKRPDVLSMLGGEGEDIELVRHA